MATTENPTDDLALERRVDAEGRVVADARADELALEDGAGERRAQLGVAVLERAVRLRGREDHAADERLEEQRPGRGGRAVRRRDLLRLDDVAVRAVDGGRELRDVRVRVGARRRERLLREGEGAAGRALEHLVHVALAGLDDAEDRLERLAVRLERLEGREGHLGLADHRLRRQGADVATDDVVVADLVLADDRDHLRVGLGGRLVVDLVPVDDVVHVVEVDAERVLDLADDAREAGREPVLAEGGGADRGDEARGGRRPAVPRAVRLRALDVHERVDDVLEGHRRLVAVQRAEPGRDARAEADLVARDLDLVLLGRDGRRRDEDVRRGLDVDLTGHLVVVLDRDREVDLGAAVVVDVRDLVHAERLDEADHLHAREGAGDDEPDVAAGDQIRTHGLFSWYLVSTSAAIGISV